eukprot:2874047-Pyramimonas_sp.AAC.1
MLVSSWCRGGEGTEHGEAAARCWSSGASGRQERPCIKEHHLGGGAETCRVQQAQTPDVMIFS